MIINHEVRKVFQKKFLKLAWHAGAGADVLAERRVRRRKIAVLRECVGMPLKPGHRPVCSPAGRRQESWLEGETYRT